MNLKSWIYALIIAGGVVAGGNYVYNQGDVQTDLQTENLGISETDTDISLTDVETWLEGIKGVAQKLKDGAKNIINEYIDKNK